MPRHSCGRQEQQLQQQLYLWFAAADKGSAGELKRMAACKAVAVDSKWGGGDALNAGTTALMIAARGGHLEAVKTLLAAGADVAMKDAEEWTALHYAAFSGHGQVIRKLLQAKAPTDGRTVFEKATPLDFATHRRFSDAIGALRGDPWPATVSAYTPEEREAAARKALRKARSTLLLHRYEVSQEGLAAWREYLVRGARASIVVPAFDTFLNVPVDVHVFPNYARPVFPNTLRRSSCSGVQNFTVCLREEADDGKGDEDEE